MKKALAICCLLVAVALGACAQGPNNAVLPLFLNGDWTTEFNTWSSHSFIIEVPGTGLLNTATVASPVSLEIGFQSGSWIDITNAMLAVTAHNSRVITQLIPIKYLGASVPYSIHYSLNCTVWPCPIRFDGITVQLQNSKDYYFGFFFKNSTNNQNMKLASTKWTNQTVLAYQKNTDVITPWAVGQSVPAYLPDVGIWGPLSLTF